MITTIIGFLAKRPLSTHGTLLLVGLFAGGWLVNTYYDSQEADELRDWLGLKQRQVVIETKIVEKIIIKEKKVQEDKPSQKEIEDHVKDIPECRINSVTERMLDRAATGSTNPATPFNKKI